MERLLNVVLLETKDEHILLRKLMKEDKMNLYGEILDLELFFQLINLIIRVEHLMLRKGFCFQDYQRYSGLWLIH
ncbi:MAG: hypothetical protein ACFFDK_14705 [Promethearchaeota archaeon]